jgi:hypothetical protein
LSPNPCLGVWSTPFRIQRWAVLIFVLNQISLANSNTKAENRNKKKRKQNKKKEKKRHQQPPGPCPGPKSSQPSSTPEPPPFFSPLFLFFADRRDPPVRSIINPWPFLSRYHCARSPPPLVTPERKRLPKPRPDVPHFLLSGFPSFSLTQIVPGRRNRSPEFCKTAVVLLDSGRYRWPRHLLLVP